MADITLVYSPTKNVDTLSLLLPALTNLLLNLLRKKHPLVKTRSLRLEVWKITGKPWKSNKFQAVQPRFFMSRRPGSIAGYKSAWNKWVSWCCQQQTDPVCASLSGILNYLSSLFEKGVQYRTINSHRSAISAYHDYVHGKPVEKHPRICALLTGVFNQKPPQPCYTFFWDFDILLVYLKTNISINSQLSDKDLTHKLIVLMAL